MKKFLQNILGIADPRKSMRSEFGAMYYLKSRKGVLDDEKTV